jgi:hypothetical protein
MILHLGGVTMLGYIRLYRRMRSQKAGLHMRFKSPSVQECSVAATNGRLEHLGSRI